MSVGRVTIATTEQKTQSCSCGCTSYDQTCCQLDCLERPRFFCGQLLTDQDLTTLLRWTQDKLRLQRFKHGWGVVCGLDVRVHADPKKACSVVVSSGYAVDCCGDDIVVCAEDELDLSKACPFPESGCAELRAPAGSAAEYADEAPIYFKGKPFSASDICAIDLIIDYKETEAVPQTALGRSACREVGTCEYSRVREGYTLRWQAASDSSPIRQVAERWLTDYRNWVINQMGEWHGAEALFQVMQHFYEAPVPGDCYHCTEEAGVPLARIWLMRPETPNASCSVLAIDPHPPYRRPFAVDPWPAPPGEANLGQFLWQRSDYDFDQVRGALADLGFRVGETIPLSAGDAEEVLRGAELFWGYASPLTLLTADMGEMGNRVVGFGYAGYSSEHGEKRAETQIAQSESGSPAPSRRDDLARISGIGPRSTEELYAQGYTSFSDIAALSTEQLRRLLSRSISNEQLESIIAQAKEFAESYP